jgi:thioredoxin reductase (NADPH)
MKKIYDLIIIGAGPAGLTCAIAAQKRKIDYTVLEKGNVVNAVINFPVDMTFFSTADQLTLADIPFNSQNFRPSRTEAVRYYQGLVTYFGLQIMKNSNVVQLIPDKNKFKIIYERRSEKHKLVAKNVIVATGFYDNPNLLGIPGEDLPHVSHYFDDPLRYFNQNVVVVGGKNSAVEAALELFRSGANVTMVHRKNELKESIKYWVLPDIQNRISEGSIKACLNSELIRISDDSVTLMQSGKNISLPADAIFLMTGYHPDIRLIEHAGVAYDKDSLEPDINEQTLETNIKGFYLAGSIIAGRNANRIFIENSRAHGNMIITDIANKLGK